MLISLFTATLIGLSAWGFSDTIGQFISKIWFWEWGAETFRTISEILGGLIIVAIGLIIYKHIVMALSAPFMSPVSEKIEAHLLGTKHTHRNTSYGTQLWRGIRINVRNLLMELIITIPILLFRVFVFTRLIIGLGSLVLLMTTLLLFVWMDRPHTSKTVLLIRQNTYTNHDVSLYDLDRHVTFDFLNNAPEISLASASPNGEQVAFSAWTADEAQHDIFIIDVPSQTLINLTTRIYLSTTQPAWSPDGESLAVRVRNPNGEHDIYTLDVSQRTHVNLTQGIGDSIEPSWSPDGQSIVFAARRPDEPDNTHIYRVDIADKEVSQLTHGDDNFYQPIWSPDGTMIAFSSIRNLYILELETDEITQLTNNTEDTNSQSLLSRVWSPDSTHIAFTSAVSWERDLYIIERDGSNLRQAGQFIRDFVVPDWASDGQSVAFIAIHPLTLIEQTIVIDINGETQYRQLHNNGPYVWIQWLD